ncbi:hypothetical protein RRG08_000888 [Elysia crispata]|uniref:Uncharacterized protein n=1 Tax=Elysia crispata TaxID=231223 RepID=A0AAE0YLA0_9GAST|nr:hypothetical protein RRG08_000888 [Elysia crispata]
MIRTPAVLITPLENSQTGAPDSYVLPETLVTPSHPSSTNLPPLGDFPKAYYLPALNDVPDTPSSCPTYPLPFPLFFPSPSFPCLLTIE